MNFEQMEHIVTVATERSITRAADKLHISNSGLSQSISQLENELGITIFNRSRKGSIPTEEGEIVIKTAIKILNNIDTLNNDLLEHLNNRKVHLKILSTPSFIYIFQQALLKYSKKNEHVYVDIQEKKLNKIMQHFEECDFDLCFVPLPLEVLMSEKNILFEHLYQDRICIIVGKNSPLYNKEYVTLNELKKYEIVLYQNSSDYLIHKIIKSNNFKVKLSSNHINIIIEIIKEYNAFIITHGSAANNYPDILNGNLKVIPIKEQNEYIYKDLWVVYPKANKLAKEVKGFIDLVKKITIG
ncbi:LysR family transcriptional regulator [Gottfriedia solisilvae]|uniref:Transcriptional regulator n=1 Tax=Gottfriedia solisilvae TaxID=1516104 RepID=A0A8J3AQH0_9BACI|nr:LysR family transcriptional regulator [Gottfriedia solisilvae]GGI17909.1 transcriptional regulator [Gottfriedia solisilvae]